MCHFFSAKCQFPFSYLSWKSEEAMTAVIWLGRLLSSFPFANEVTNSQVAVYWFYRLWQIVLSVQNLSFQSSCWRRNFAAFSGSATLAFSLASFATNRMGKKRAHKSLVWYEWWWKRLLLALHQFQFTHLLPSSFVLTHSFGWFSLCIGRFCTGTFSISVQFSFETKKRVSVLK